MASEEMNENAHGSVKQITGVNWLLKISSEARKQVRFQTGHAGLSGY